MPISVAVLPPQAPLLPAPVGLPGNKTLDVPLRQLDGAHQLCLLHAPGFDLAFPGDYLDLFQVHKNLPLNWPNKGLSSSTDFATQIPSDPKLMLSQKVLRWLSKNFAIQGLVVFQG
jgi:hypothetical protein